MKNYLSQTLVLSFVVLLLLSLLSLVPEGTKVAGFELRRMDIFSDIRRSPADSVATDSLATLDTLKKDTIPVVQSLFDTMGWVRAVSPDVFGSIIEDYTPEQTGLDRFYEAIDDIRTKNRTVRVAVFGDSFIEGDILLGDLRDTLQTLWGGKGVGYVPITSVVARFKRTLVHRYENWKPYSIVKNFRSGQPFGINGFVYQPRPGAAVEYEGARYFKHTRRWTRLRLFYKADTTNHFVWQFNEPVPILDSLSDTQGALGVWSCPPGQGSMYKFAFRVDEPNSNLLFYGATLESGPGIYLDNFSVRGNTGGRLKLIRSGLARQFDAVQQYELIIVQLGLNAVTSKLDNIGWYEAELDQTFRHLRRCFPEKPILVISVPDRGGKVEGELGTLKSVPVIANMQRELARKHGFLFYDLFNGMGGSGSMIEYAERKQPPMANRDYTHLTHYGGKILGYQFADLFVREQQRYREKLQNQPSQ